MRATLLFGRLLAGVAGAAAVASGAHAAITVYDTTSSFASATKASTLGLDTFDDLAGGSFISSPLPRTAGTYSYTATASLGGLYGAGGGADSWLSTEEAASTITFSGFHDDISAIGGLFFDSDVSGAFASGAIRVSVADSLGATSVLTLDSASLSSFRGFTTNGHITSLTVAALQPEMGVIWPTVNNLTLGEAVPEPATWAMMILGLGLAGATLRRRALPSGTA